MRALYTIRILLLALGLLCTYALNARAQDTDSSNDIAVISREPTNNIYITHASNVVGERYLTPLGENTTGGFLEGNFGGATGDGKDDFACVTIDATNQPHLTSTSSPGNISPSTWATLLQSAQQDYFYFTTGDFDGDGIDDVATFYRDYTGSNPNSDVRVKITYGPEGATQLSDAEDWALPNEIDSAFIIGKFIGQSATNDNIADIMAISKSGNSYIGHIYRGALGELYSSTWTITPPTTVSTPVSFGAGDYNNDGYNDVAMVFFDSSTNVYKARVTLGPTGSTVKTWSLGSGSFESFFFKDFNNDGIADIGAIDHTSSDYVARIFLGSSTGTLSTFVRWNLKNDVEVAGFLAGDFGRLKSVISGTVYRFGGNVGLAGATLTLRLKGSDTVVEAVQSDSSGAYAFHQHANDNYYITAEKNGHTFSPSSKDVTISDAPVSSVNFTSTNDPHVYHITGRIYRSEVPTEGLHDMKVVATGGNDTSGIYSVEGVTDAQGYYSLTVSLGEFSVTPANPYDANFVFVPISRDVSVSLFDEGDVNFTDLGTDRCPYDPDKVEAGICGCNVVDLDSDSDGTYDCHDQCPYDPKKIVPSLCGCGVVDYDINGNNRCDWDEIADPSVTKYKLRGRVVELDENGNVKRGIGGIIVRTATSAARSRTIREAYDILDSYPAGTNVDDLVGQYTLTNLLSADQNVYIDPNDQGEANGALRYFDLRVNAERQECPDRTSIQRDAAGNPILDTSGNTQYLTDAQRVSIGGVLCRYAPLRVNRSLVGIDFAVQSCRSGWSRDNDGVCSKLSLAAPKNLTATKGTDQNKVTLEFDGSQGATSYEIYAMRDPYAKTSSTGDLASYGTVIAVVHMEECSIARHCVYEDRKPIPGVAYRYNVRAVNDFTSSDYSSSATGWRAVSEYLSGDDSDGDGSTDQDEINDGTNPYDQGSFVTHLWSPAYTKYNTYLNQVNYLELVSTGEQAVRARLTIYNQHGKRIGHAMNIVVRAHSQYDVDINSLVGKKDTYGMVRIDFNYRDTGVALAGRMSVYRPDPNQENLPFSERTYSFAYARELRNPTRGSTYATANTKDPQDAGNYAANWVEIMNTDSVARRFTVHIYNSRGKMIYDSDNAVDENKKPLAPIVVPARGEVDVSGGHELKDDGIYLVEVQPIDGGTNYFATVTRYGHVSTTGVVSDSDSDSFNFAIPLDAKNGNGDTQFVPISNLAGECWSQSNMVELINVSGDYVSTKVLFRNAAGKIIARNTYKLKATAQLHLNAGALLPAGQSGVAQIVPNRPGAVIAQSMVYFHDCQENRLQAAYSSPSYISGQEVQVGSYNRYLEMTNLLKVVSTSSNKIGLSIDIRTDRGVRSGLNQTRLSSYQSKQFNLSDSKTFKTKPDSYGQLIFNTDSRKRLMVENVRIREKEGKIDFAFPTAVK